MDGGVVETSGICVVERMAGVLLVASVWWKPLKEVRNYSKQKNMWNKKKM